MTAWQLQKAKANLSEVIRRANADGPQRITVRGRAAAVLLSEQDYERLKRPRLEFVAFMRRSPLAGLALEFSRQQTLTRDPEVA